MSGTARDFGRLPTGEGVEEVVIACEGGAEARIITYGAAVRDLEVPVAGGRRGVVLGLNSAEDYARHSRHFGATAGRFANRIRGGRIVLDGREVELERNMPGGHTLHGGARGFGKRVWQIAAQTADSVTLTLVSEDGDGGFPGRLQAAVTYRLAPPATLAIEMSARTDRTTVVNLVHHSYFNLAGEGDVLDHELKLASRFFTPTDADNLPTGEIRASGRTALDFTARRKIRRSEDGRLVRYDNNHVLDRADGSRPDELIRAASLWAPDGKLKMEVWTTAPGLQVYDGAKLDVLVPGLGGRRYGACAGLCLEPQVFPDSPNFAHFSPSVLRPGETWRQRTEYRFEAAA